MSDIVTKNQLTSSQREVAEIFATNDIHQLTIAEIADRVGVNERTIYRWKKNREFLAYQNAIAEVAMEDALTEAYSRVKSLLRNGKSEKTQLEAIKIVLQNRGKLKDTHEHTHTVENKETQEQRERRIIDMENELLGDSEN